MQKIDIRDMNKARAQNRALELFKDLRPNESLMVIDDQEPKIIYDILKQREDLDKKEYEVRGKGNKFIAEFLKKS